MITHVAILTNNMKFTKTIKETVEHSTREDYVIIENCDEYRSEIHCHGYDQEDSHLHDWIKELKFENPECTYSLQFIRSVTL